MKKQHLIISLLIVLVVMACKNETGNTMDNDKGLTEISKKQFQTENMLLGTLEKVEIQNNVSFTGKIVPKTNGKAKISPPLAGIIQSVHVKSGQYVKANETILKIGGVKLIDLQREYASSAAKIKQLKANYEKAQKLFEENINTENEFLLAESDYNVEKANYSALKAKIMTIGLDLSIIEKGEYFTEYSVKSPIAGQISKLSVLMGQYVTRDNEIAEVINSNKMELQLTLFGKDFTKTRKGQRLVFSSIDYKLKQSVAIVDRIESSLDLNTNSFNCYASIIDDVESYAVNQIVEGEIIVSVDSVWAIPQSAVFAIGSKYNVLVLESDNDTMYSFRKLEVKTGRENDDYIEIIEGINDEEILTKGTYNLNLE